MDAGVGIVEDIGKNSHKWASKESGNWDSMVAEKLLKLGLLGQKPRINVIGQCEMLCQFAIIE